MSAKTSKRTSTSRRATPPTPVRVHHHVLYVLVEPVITDGPGKTHQRRTRPRTDSRASAENGGVVIIASLWKPSNSLMEREEGVGRDASLCCRGNLKGHTT